MDGFFMEKPMGVQAPLFSETSIFTHLQNHPTKPSAFETAFQLHHG